MGELSIAQQALGLRTEFPGSQVQVSAQALAWTGVLTPTPLSRNYTVTLTYRPGRWPIVLIVDPALRCDVDGGIPHLYRDGTICLYDTNQWNPALLFVDTIVPWTSEWLHHYELWVATDTWYGDGDVPVDLTPIDTPDNPPSPVDQRRPSTRANRPPLHAVTAKIGHNEHHADGATPHTMTGLNKPTALGASLKTQRRKQRLSLRDLADETGISFNTLSRVERGYLPDLKNYQKIVDWLGVPADTFLDLDNNDSPVNTPDVIARHLRSDARLDPSSTAKIVKVVQDMYAKLVSERPALAVHMRSAKTFTPEAGTLLANMLSEMQQKLLDESKL